MAGFWRVSTCTTGLFLTPAATDCRAHGLCSANCSLQLIDSGHCHHKLCPAGKPNKPAYGIATKKLQAQLDELAKQSGREGASHALKHIYAFGDNPKSDVRGANSAGNIWRSVLVCTGVYKVKVHALCTVSNQPAHIRNHQQQREFQWHRHAARYALIRRGGTCIAAQWRC